MLDNEPRERRPQEVEQRVLAAIAHRLGWLVAKIAVNSAEKAATNGCRWANEAPRQSELIS